jgi:CIC family chloride channel protein
VWAALKRLGTRDVGRLPVVDRQNPKRLVGVIRRHDIVRAYKVGIGRKLEMQSRTDRLRLGKLTGTEFIDVEVSPHSAAAHRTVKKLNLPEDCVLVSVLRDNRVIIPHGDTRLMPGDRLTALVGLGCMPEFQRILHDATNHNRSVGLTPASVEGPAGTDEGQGDSESKQ